MGHSLSCSLNRLCGREKVRVLIDGLDGGGKTTILYRWILGETVKTIHTIGFNVEEYDYRNIHFTFWDLGGGDKIRPLRRHYYADTKVLIFVVDSTDTERLSEAAYELATMLNADELSDVILLVFANKQDLPNALAAGNIAETLGLNSLRNKRWRIQASSAIDGEGLDQGLDWLCSELSKAR